MRILPIIQARMGSRRLPGKVMLDLAGKPILEHVVDFGLSLGVEKPIVVTTQFPEEKPIHELCDKKGILCESAMNKPLEVFSWFVRAIEKYRPDHVVRICGDSPFLNVEMAKELIRLVQFTLDADYYSYMVSHKGQSGPGILCKAGIFVEVISSDSILFANEYLNLPQYVYEHTTPIFYKQRKIFKTKYLGWQFDNPIKLSIDTKDDYDYACNIAENKLTDYNVVAEYDKSIGRDFGSFFQEYDWL